uniref:Uncharacterized protein n=1 Tax=Panagrolaimus superbus TaxID=310955 RepID=A0A914XW80_9BILA
MLYNDTSKRFKFDHEKADAFRNQISNEHSNAHKNSFSLGGMFEAVGINFGFSHGEKKTNANSAETEKKSKDNIHVDDVQKALEKKSSNVKWTGKKFEQKNFDLYRINTKNLHSVTEQVFNRVVVSKEQSGQQIDIKMETNTMEFDHIYDEKTTTTTSTSTTTTTTTTQFPPSTVATKIIEIKCNPNNGGCINHVAPVGLGRGAAPMGQAVAPYRGPIQNEYGGYNQYRNPNGYGYLNPVQYRNPPQYRNPMQYRNPVQYGYGGNAGMRAPVQYRNPYQNRQYYPYRTG